MVDRAKIRCAALLYHHVGPRQAGVYPQMSMETALFAREIAWLARRGYTAIRASDWLAWRRGSGKLPDKPIMVTFDDAYADIAEHALPVLQRYGFTATVFVVTARIGTTNTWDEQNGYARLPLMTAEQIRAWAAAGVEFGAHGRTHADLTKLDRAALNDEVEGSGTDLSNLLGKPVTSFAYPFGAWDEKVRSAAAAHFQLAFSCMAGTNDSKTDPHLLKRGFLPSRPSMLDFALTARTGGLHRIGELRIRLALRTRLRRLLGRS